MGFTCKIVLADRQKEDRTRQVYLQAYIDRQRATVALGFCIKDEQWNAKTQQVKNHPNAKEFNTELAVAIQRAHSIASQARLEERLLTPDTFKSAYKDPSEKMDVIKFMRSELLLKSVNKNTVKRHTTVINKLNDYRVANKKKLGPFLSFQHLTPELIQAYKQHLLTTNKITTVNKDLATIKEYLTVALKKGIKFKDPFQVTKIKHFKSTRLALSQKEVDRLEVYYFKEDCPRNHKHLLQYFLFSCYTGLRISDIRTLTWNDIHDGVIVRQLVKGEENNPKLTTIPIAKPAFKFLPTFQKGQYKVFSPFAEQYSNRMLKDICALDEVNIKKKVTYHSSRHTFGSLFAIGGDVTALKDIMGHGSITTTMGYVHKNPEDLINAVKSRFGE